MLQIDLKSHFSNPGSGDEASLVEKLEYIMKQQVRKPLKVLCSYQFIYSPIFFKVFTVLLLLLLNLTLCINPGGVGSVSFYSLCFGTVFLKLCILCCKTCGLF